MTIQEIIEAWNGCCSGGGGDSDFSTAQVTLICNAADEEEVVVGLAIAQEAALPFVPNPQTKASLSMYNGSEYTATAVLYKGYCNCLFSGASGLSGEGDVTTYSNQSATITGDCTITIS